MLQCSRTVIILFQPSTNINNQMNKSSLHTAVIQLRASRQLNVPPSVQIHLSPPLKMGVWTQILAEYSNKLKS